jgi:hypothetical protein
MCAKDTSNSYSVVEDGLRLMRHCPLCETEYKFDQIDLIDEDANAHLVHITCTVCTSKMLAIITMSGFGMSSIGMITDLTASDAGRFQSAEPISADDLLDLYEVLQRDRVIEHALAHST